jgi:pyruvate carboxylase subunit A
MEMSTRVQVEHHHREEITGIDIVREQIRIASGLNIGKNRRTLSTVASPCVLVSHQRRGPKNNFLPSFGKITRYYAPAWRCATRRSTPATPHSAVLRSMC